MAKRKRRIEFNLKAIQTFASFGFTQKKVAEYHGADPETLMKFIKKQGFESWDEFTTKFMGDLQTNLIAKAVGMGLNGDREMLKLCLKNLCDWKERFRPDLELPTIDTTQDYQIVYEEVKPDAYQG